MADALWLNCIEVQCHCLLLTWSIPWLRQEEPTYNTEPNEPEIQIIAGLIAMFWNIHRSQLLWLYCSQGLAFSTIVQQVNAVYYIEHWISAFWVYLCLAGPARFLHLPCSWFFREDVGPLTHMNPDPWTLKRPMGTRLGYIVVLKSVSWQSAYWQGRVGAGGSEFAFKLFADEIAWGYLGDIGI